MEKRFLSPKEVSEILQVSISTISNLCKANKIKHIKIGGSIKFKEEWIDEYIRLNTKGY